MTKLKLNNKSTFNKIKMKKILLTFLILLSTYSFAADVSGKVLLDKETTFENCTITFTPVSPSAVFAQTTSQMDGTFIASIANGVYNIKYEKEGYQTYELLNLFLNDNVVLDNITLSSNNIILVSGDVLGTWKKGNTYRVIDNITVPSNETLIIEPGVEIKFDGNYSLTVNGTILAKGSKDNYIYFTSNKTTPTNKDWDHIIINTKTKTSIMDYCIVEYGSSSITEYSFVNIYGNLNLSNSIIRHSNSSGVVNTSFSSRNNINITNNKIYKCQSGILIRGTSSVVITNNEVHDNLDYGIYIGNDTNSAIVKQNTVYNCSTAGIFVESNIKIERNIVFKNGFCGIETIDSKPTIVNNTIMFNHNGIRVYSNKINTIANPIINSNMVTNNLFQGITSAGENALPFISYNLFYNNGYGTGNSLPVGVGPIVTKNANNTPSDAYYNIFVDPEFESNRPTDSNFSYLLSNSPAIDAGDPSIKTYNGTIVDIGATELGGNLSVIKNELASMNVKVFPNPVLDYLNFQSTDIRTFNAIMIYDLNGKTIDAINTKNQESEFNWKVPGHLKNGVYMYQVRNNNTILGSGKFIKK